MATLRSVSFNGRVLPINAATRGQSTLAPNNSRPPLFAFLPLCSDSAHVCTLYSTLTLRLERLWDHFSSARSHLRGPAGAAGGGVCAWLGVGAPRSAPVACQLLSGASPARCLRGLALLHRNPSQPTHRLKVAIVDISIDKPPGKTMQLAINDGHYGPHFVQESVVSASIDKRLASSMLTCTVNRTRGAHLRRRR